jgi:hypothetical protein
MNVPPFPGCYWIQAGWIAGPYPRSHEITALIASGVTLFLDLTEEGELPPYLPDLPEGIEHRRMPIRDFSIPTAEHMERILQILDAELAAGRTLYLHCHGGIGRTGTVAGCHLVRCGLTGKEALLEIRRLRREAGCDPDSPETAAQCNLVRLWPRGQAHD